MTNTPISGHHLIPIGDGMNKIKKLVKELADAYIERIKEVSAKLKEKVPELKEIRFEWTINTAWIYDPVDVPVLVDGFYIIGDKEVYEEELYKNDELTDIIDELRDLVGDLALFNRIYEVLPSLITIEEPIKITIEPV